MTKFEVGKKYKFANDTLRQMFCELNVSSNDEYIANDIIGADEFEVIEIDRDGFVSAFKVGTRNTPHYSGDFDQSFFFSDEETRFFVEVIADPVDYIRGRMAALKTLRDECHVIENEIIEWVASNV